MINREKKVRIANRDFRTDSVPHLDYEIGDFIQLGYGIREHAGRIGRIIGITLKRRRNGEFGFVYTIKLSEKESVATGSDHMKLLRRDQLPMKVVKDE